MALGVKYRIEHFNRQTQEMWRVDFLTEGFVGVVTDLKPGEDPWKVIYKTNIDEPHWWYAPSRAEFAFIDDGTGLFQDLFSANNSSFVAEIWNDDNTELYWRGFVNPDSYDYGLYVAGESVLTATDRMASLPDITWEASAGVPYAGQRSFVDMAALALKPLGIDIGLATHMMWTSHLATNPLLIGTHDSMWHHTKEALSYTDDDGRSFTCQQVIDDICNRFQVQLFQYKGRWQFLHARRDVQPSPDFIYVFHYDSDGAKDTPYTDLPLAKYPTGRTSNIFRAVPRARGVQPINQASIVYQHGKLTELFDNTDFETEGTPLPGWELLGTGDSITTSTDGFGGSGKAINIPTSFQADPDLPTTLPNRGIRQITSETIESASGYQIRFRVQIKQPQWNDLPVGKKTVWVWRLKVGSNYYNWATSSWTASVTWNRVNLHLFNPSANWWEFSTTTPVLDAQSGAVDIEIYGVIEEDDLTTGKTQLVTRFDDVMIEFIRDGLLVTEATLTTVVSDTIPGSDTLDTVTVVTGEGPLSTFHSSIRQLDSTEADVGTATDWQFGYGGTANNINLDELWGVERLRAFFQPVRQISGTIVHVETFFNAPEVDQYAEIERPDTTDLDFYMWYNELTWRGSQPERVMEGFWFRVLEDDPGTSTTVTQGVEEGPSGASVLTGNLGTINITTNTTTVTLDTVADLGTTNVGAAATTVFVRQFQSGTAMTGGGLFLGDPLDTSTPADGGTVFVSADGKRWHRIFAEDEPWRTEWFGAKWDGVSDDSAAIQATIDAARGGATILLPSKRTVIGARVDIDSKVVQLKGESPSYHEDNGQTGFPVTASGTIILSSSTIDTALFRVVDTVTTSAQHSGVVFESIKFIGNKDGVNFGTATDTHAVEFINAYRFRMIRCEVTNFTSHGIDTLDPDILFGGETSHQCEILNNAFVNNGGDGALLSLRDSIIRDNVAFNNDGGGFAEGLFGTNGGNSWIGNRAEQNEGDGFALIASLGVTRVIGNSSLTNGGRGMLLGTGLAVINHLICSNNIIDGNGTNALLPPEEASGIVLAEIQNSIVSNNVVTNNGQYGIMVIGNYQASMQGNRGTGNALGFSNTRVQNLDPAGWYSAVEWGMPQAGVDVSLRLQALIDTIEPGSVIVFPPGDYLFLNPVVINKQVTLKGWASGWFGDTTGTRFGVSTVSADVPCIELIAGADGTVIDGITFTGLGGASPSTNVTGIKATLVNDLIIRNCNIEDWFGKGIDLNDCRRVRLNENNFDQNTSGGLLATLCVDLDVINCRSEDNFDEPQMKFVNCTRLKVIGGTVARRTQSSQPGLLVLGGTEIEIFQVTAHDLGGPGFKVTAGDRIRIHDCQAVSCGADNALTDAERAGIYLDGGSNISVQNNDCSDPLAVKVQQYGISTGANLGSATILNNTGAGNELALLNLESTTAADVITKLAVSADLDFPLVAANSSQALSVTVPGARVNDGVTIGAPSDLNAGLIPRGIVTADDTVEVRVFNVTGAGINEAEKTYMVICERTEASVSVTIPPVGDFTKIVELEFTNHNLLYYG